MFDGIVRTLTDVMHVQSFQRNLISLGALDSKGYKCTIEGRVVKVVNGALAIMNGEIVKYLYRLIGDAILGGAVKVTLDKTGRKHIVQVELDAAKSLEDRLTSISKMISNDNP